MYSFLPLCAFALLCQVQGTWAREAREGEFPYQAAVLLRLRNDQLLYICSGAILNQRYILTLAFCAIQYQPSTINILVGSNDLARRNNIYYSVDTVRQFSRPKYNVTIFSRNNIAVVRVKNLIIFNQRVQPIVISSQDVMNGQTYSLTAFRNYIFSYQGGPIASQSKQLSGLNIAARGRQQDKIVAVGLRLAPYRNQIYAAINN
ncbi:unnamed protein product [Pieris macdunnoughi]|uniref:Peptidase S1 domain-containing protein n=1 Tax=Pieris macdunnoughi TaxID=345717 RepID=A0A821QX11_9NEOP|nr:unnamed protein product [Pieris macdunnoughi]